MGLAVLVAEKKGCIASAAMETIRVHTEVVLAASIKLRKCRNGYNVFVLWKGGKCSSDRGRRP